MHLCYEHKLTHHLSDQYEWTALYKDISYSILVYSESQVLQWLKIHDSVKIDNLQDGHTYPGYWGYKKNPNKPRMAYYWIKREAILKE